MLVRYVVIPTVDRIGDNVICFVVANHANSYYCNISMTWKESEMLVRYVAIPTVGLNQDPCHLFRCCESCKFSCPSSRIGFEMQKLWEAEVMILDVGSPSMLWVTS